MTHIGLLSGLKTEIIDNTNLNYSFFNNSYEAFISDSESIVIFAAVSFNVSPPSGATTFRFFQGSTANNWGVGTLTGVPAGTTATYNSATSTLSVTVP